MIAQTNAHTQQDVLSYWYPTGEGRTRTIYPDFHLLSAPTNPVSFLARADAQKENAFRANQPFSNGAQNSRNSQGLKDEQLQLVWKIPVIAGLMPRFVIPQNDVAIVEAMTLQLFKNAGQLLQSFGNGSGHVLAYAGHDMFYFIDPGGKLTGCSLADGSIIFNSQTVFGDNYKQVFITLKDEFITCAGNELPSSPRQRPFPDQSIITRLSLKHILTAKKGAENLYASETGSLIVNSGKMIAAAFEDEIIFTYPNRIMVANADLDIVAAYKDMFEPCAISTDETGRIYLLNDNEKGRSLWLITKEGEKIYSAEVPGALIHPPIVGYDHRVFIPGSNNIAVIGSDGIHSMNYPVKHQFGGAIITADDKLVVSDGPDLVSFDKNGESTVLYNFGADDLCTPPTITASGKILVASKQFLYCLEGK